MIKDWFSGFGLAGTLDWICLDVLQRFQQPPISLWMLKKVWVLQGLTYPPRKVNAQFQCGSFLSAGTMAIDSFELWNATRIVSHNLGQLDLRILAHTAGCPDLIRALSSGLGSATFFSLRVSKRYQHGTSPKESVDQPNLFVQMSGFCCSCSAAPRIQRCDRYWLALPHRSADVTHGGRKCEVNSAGSHSKGSTGHANLLAPAHWPYLCHI